MTSGDPRPPDAVCDGGDLDCGSGLLLILREAMAPLPEGGVLEVRSREISVKEDLPAWCRMVGHELLSVDPAPNQYTHFRIAKKTKGQAGAEPSLHRDLEQARNFTWSARVRWTAGMQARAFVRNHAFTVGQPASFDTSDAAPSAVELLLAALGACVAVGFQWRASRRAIDVRNLEVSLKGSAEDVLVYLGIDDPSKGHPGFKAIEVTVYVDADAEETALQSLLDETIVRSPVAQTLLRSTPVQVALRRA